jgi:hypothetical protein
MTRWDVTEGGVASGAAVKGAAKRNFKVKEKCSAQHILIIEPNKKIVIIAIFY